MQNIITPVWTEEKIYQEEMTHSRLSMIKNRALFETIALRDYMFDSFPGLDECTVYSPRSAEPISCGELYDNDRIHEELDAICLTKTLDANLTGMLFDSLGEVPVAYASDIAVYMVSMPMMGVFGKGPLEELGQILHEFSHTGLSSSTFMDLLQNYSGD